MYERSPRYYGILVYLLFIVSTGSFFAMDVSSKTVTPDWLQTHAIAMQHQDDTDDVVCSDYLLKVSEDGVRYVREAGGGTLFVASVNGKTGFYELDHNNMIPVRGSEVDQYTARRLEQAFSECHGNYMRAGTYFDPFYHDKATTQVAMQDITVMNEKTAGKVAEMEISGESRPAAAQEPEVPAAAPEQEIAENRPGTAGMQDMVVAATVPAGADVILEADTDMPEIATAESVIPEIATAESTTAEIATEEIATEEIAKAGSMTEGIATAESTTEETAKEGNAELSGGNKVLEEPATMAVAEAAARQEAPAAAELEPRADRNVGQSWNINLASLSDKANADRFIAHARDKGVETTRTHVTVNGNKYWRISVKGFVSPEEAKAGSVRIKEQLGLKEVWISKEAEQNALRETAHKNSAPEAG